MRSINRPGGHWLLLAGMALASLGHGGIQAQDALPDGVRQVVPRGSIAAVMRPRFVDAAKAQIPDDAWVLGVQIGGQARAYALNLLNDHEVVNDQVGDTAFAAVWCPLANTAVVYDRRYQNRELSFEASGAMLQSSLVMRDRETDSWWSIMTGDAIGGSLAGTPLRQLPVGEKTTWARWRERHPETQALSVDGREYLTSDPYRDYFESDGTYRGQAVTDKRLAAKAMVFALRLDGQAFAVPHAAVEGGKLLRPKGRLMFFYRPRDAPRLASTRVYDVSPEQVPKSRSVEDLLALAERGELKPFDGDGFDVYWYIWAVVSPETRLVR